MANKIIVSFACNFKGDHTDTTVQIKFALSPVSYFPYGASGGSLGSLTEITTDLPASVSNVTCSGGLSVTSVDLSVLNTILTVTLGSAPTDGTLYTLSGYLEFTS